MTAEGIARTLAKMIKWGKWERNVLVLCEGSFDPQKNWSLRFNEQFAHLDVVKHHYENSELDARIAWLREKWATSRVLRKPAVHVRSEADYPQRLALKGVIGHRDSRNKK